MPEFWRANYGADFPESASFLRAASTPHLLDAVEIARGKPLAWKQTDDERTDIASFILKTYQPHLMVLHLTDLDSAQHTYGPGSPEALETLERMDGRSARCSRRWTRTSTYDHTYVAIVSDHGFLPIERQLHPERALQAGRTAVGRRRRTDHVVEGRVSTRSGGSGYVYLRDPADHARCETGLGAPAAR